MAVIQDHESTSRSPGGSALFVCNFEEITAARSRRQKLEYRARHDSLTGLLNRDACKEILAAVKHGRRGTDSAYALMFCDLDYFKDINDRYGHLLGDAVLETVADGSPLIGSEEMLSVPKTTTKLPETSRLAA
mgnify:CR=1 FL=1